MPIDDQFWLNFAAEAAKNSINILNAAAEKIRGIFLWAFGIYTASAVFTIDYKNIKDSYLIAILLAPIVLLIVGYWFAFLPLMPFTQDVDSSSANSIEQAYARTYNDKKRKLQLANTFLLIALISVACALITAYLIKSRA